MVFAGGDDGHVAFGNRHFLVTGGNDAGSLGDDEDLVATVGVELVADAGSEVNDAEVEVVAVVRIQDGLPADGAGEQGGRFLRSFPLRTSLRFSWVSFTSRMGSGSNVPKMIPCAAYVV